MAHALPDKIETTQMPYTVTTRKRSGAEHTNVAHTECAAMSLAQMMRRAGDEYSSDSMVTVRDGSGSIVAAWRGGGYGWQPITQSLQLIDDDSPSLQPLASKVVPRASSRFMRVPTESMQSSVSVSIVTEHSAA